MSSVIDFLEKFGQDAQLRHATGVELEEAFARAGIDPALKAALLGSDQRLIASLIGAAPNVCCMVNVPDEEGECTPEASCG